MLLYLCCLPCCQGLEPRGEALHILARDPRWLFHVFDPLWGRAWLLSHSQWREQKSQNKRVHSALPVSCHYNTHVPFLWCLLHVWCPIQLTENKIKQTNRIFNSIWIDQAGPQWLFSSCWQTEGPFQCKTWISTIHQHLKKESRAFPFNIFGQHCYGLINIILTFSLSRIIHS